MAGENAQEKNSPANQYPIEKGYYHHRQGFGLMKEPFQQGSMGHPFHDQECDSHVNGTQF